MSLRLGIIGHPLTHTLSPFIHQAFLKQFGMPGSYEVLPCQKALDQIALASDQGFKGLNVTIPHKVTVALAIDKLTVQAKLVGAVNTICFGESHCDDDFVDTAGGDRSGAGKANWGQISGHNTDVIGLTRVFKTHEVQGQVVILGAGGAARAAIVALEQHGCPGVIVVARQYHKAQSMLQSLLVAGLPADFLANCSILSIEQLPLKLDLIARAGCFINASPIGQGLVELPFWLTPFLNSFERDALILDLVYAKGGRTALCQLAKGTGFRRVEDGRQMLVEQARQAFKIWTGLTAAYSVGFDALEKAQTAG